MSALQVVMLGIFVLTHSRNDAYADLASDSSVVKGIATRTASGKVRIMKVLMNVVESSQLMPPEHSGLKVHACEKL